MFRSCYIPQLQLPRSSAAAFPSFPILFRSLVAHPDHASLHSQFCTVCGTPYWHRDFVRLNSFATSGPQLSKGSYCDHRCNSENLSSDAKTLAEKHRGESPTSCPLAQPHFPHSTYLFLPHLHLVFPLLLPVFHS